MSEEIYKCDECGDRFLRFTIDPNDALDFDHIIQLDGVLLVFRSSPTPCTTR